MGEDQALAAVQKYGSISKAAKALKIAESTLRDRVRKARGELRKPSGVRSLDDFRSQYDKSTIVPQRIAAGLVALGDGWAFESEFCKLANINPVDLSRFRDGYSEHIVITPGDRKRAWFGRKADAAKMRERI